MESPAMSAYVSSIAEMAKTHPGFLGYLGTPSGKFLIYDPATGKERELQ